MIVTTLVDVFTVQGNWYEVVIEVEPAACRHPWHRWWVEVNARTTAWPSGTAKGINHHYYQFDFEALTFRSAVIRGGRVVWKLTDYLETHPNMLPTPDGTVQYWDHEE